MFNSKAIIRIIRTSGIKKYKRGGVWGWGEGAGCPLACTTNQPYVYTTRSNNMGKCLNTGSWGHSKTSGHMFHITCSNFDVTSHICL